MSEPQKPNGVGVSVVTCADCGGLFRQDHPRMVNVEGKDADGNVVSKHVLCARCVAEHHPEVVAQMRSRIVKATGVTPFLRRVP